MHILKIALLLTSLAGSFASYGMERASATIVDTLTGEFFYNIYPSYSSIKNPDETRQLMALGQSYFIIADNSNRTVKTCRTNHQKISHAFYDKSGKYIITTASDQTVDIYNANGDWLLSITDEQDGIHLGVFGLQDGHLVVITNSKLYNNLSKVWMVPCLKEASF